MSIEYIPDLPIIISTVASTAWCILHGRVSYGTLSYTCSKSWCGYNVAHESNSYFNISNGISQNTKCNNLVTFCKSSHTPPFVLSYRYKTAV